MDTVIYCDCGFEARAADAKELVAEVQRHAREAHGMALSEDDALLVAFRAQLDATSRSAAPGSSARREDEA
jgi:hypothetical protein